MLYLRVRIFNCMFCIHVDILLLVRYKMRFRGMILGTIEDR